MQILRVSTVEKILLKDLVKTKKLIIKNLYFLGAAFYLLDPQIFFFFFLIYSKR